MNAAQKAWATRRGWHSESGRHSLARKNGVAGPLYKSTGKKFSADFKVPHGSKTHPAWNSRKLGKGSMAFKEVPIKPNGYSQKWDIRSESDPSIFYRVSRRSSGEYECSCPVWKFKRQECKHIRKIKEGGSSCKADSGEVRKEMKEHPWADKKTAEQIACDHENENKQYCWTGIPKSGKGITGGFGKDAAECKRQAMKQNVNVNDKLSYFVGPTPQDLKLRAAIVESRMDSPKNIENAALRIRAIEAAKAKKK